MATGKLCLRIETTDGYGPYDYAPRGVFPNDYYDDMRQPCPHNDLGDWDGHFGFPGVQAMSRWFRRNDRLRLKRTHKEVTWGVAVYKAWPTAESRQQLTFYKDMAERLAFLPIDAPTRVISRQLKELANGKR